MLTSLYLKNYRSSTRTSFDHWRSTYLLPAPPPALLDQFCGPKRPALDTTSSLSLFLSSLPQSLEITHDGRRTWEQSGKERAADFAGDGIMVIRRKKAKFGPVR